MSKPACVVCGSRTHFDSSITSSWSKQKFDFFRCESCNIGFTNTPRTDFAEIYSETYYRGRGADAKVNYIKEVEEPASAEAKIRHLEFKGIYKTILKLNSKKSDIRVLDFGGGVGSLTLYLNNRGINTDFHEQGIGKEFAKKYGIKSTDEVKDSQYDFIIAIEVLEHLVEPLKEIEKLAYTLKPGGYLLLTTGNLEKHKGKISKWSYAQIPDVHIIFWTKSALDRVFGNLNIKNAKIRLNSSIIQYKIIKNLPFKTFLYMTRFLWWPVCIFVDKIKGVSEVAVWQKSGY